MDEIIQEKVMANMEVGDILRSNGEEFATQAAMLAAITKVNCIDTHSVMQTENGGWIGVPIGDPRLKVKRVEPPKTNQKKKYPVRVFRTSGDEANRDHVIKITANGPNERAVFKPGEKFELTETQLNILRDSIIDTEIEIEPNSGIYSARDPQVAAQNMFPDMQIIRDPYTGRIVCRKRIPNYAINFLGDRPPGWID